MAEFKVCAVRDRAIDAFGNPITVPALGAALRSFADEIANPSSEFHRHPDDYDLYHLADFDSSTGVFTPVVPPQMISIGKSIAEATASS